MEGTADVPMISERNNLSVQSSAPVSTTSKRTHFKNPHVKLLTDSKMSISELQSTNFSVVSENSIVEKGVLIHIVEDPNITRHTQEGQSAVFINVPTETNAISCDIFSSALVTVSLQYLAAIPEDRSIFFNNLCASVDIKVSDNTNEVTLHGTWNEILEVQAEMKAYLSSWTQQDLMKKAFQTLNDPEISNLSCVKQDDRKEKSANLMRTRHQEKQKEKLQAQVSERSGVSEEENSTLEPAPPRENKENEVHLSISMSSRPCPAEEEKEESESQLCIIPSSSTEQCLTTNKIKGPKKNYELLAPFKFFCTLCSFKTKRESHYQRHLLRHETVSSLYSCDTCNFTTIRLGHLRRHELTHSTSTMLSCSLCSYHTDDARHLSRHHRIKHPGQEEKINEKPLEVLSCSKCSYSTTKMHLFQRHLKVHSKDARRQGLRSFQCEQCSYKTTRKEHYLRHVNNVHQNRRPYLCDFCGKAFKRPDALKQHGITHAEVDPTVSVFRCSFCNKGCRSQAHLNEHLAVHSNVRSFLCEICGLSFKTRSVQRKHVLTIHKNPHAYSCNRCLKRFNTKYALRRHMKQHSWKDDTIEEECGVTTHAVVIQGNETNTNSSQNLLTVQVPEEILSTLPSGAVAVPLFSVMPHTMKKETASATEGVAAAEVLALQLTQMQNCSETNQDSMTPQNELQNSQQFLTTATDPVPNLLYVTTNYEQY